MHYAKIVKLGHNISWTDVPEIILIERDQNDPFSMDLQARLSAFSGRHITRMTLNEISLLSVPPKSVVVSTIELEKPLLIDITPEELRLLQILTTRSSLLLWLTGGSLYKAGNPNFSPVFGLSRALMLELPSLKFLLLDVEPVSKELEAAKRNSLKILELALDKSNREFEYLQHDGMLYSSRFSPDACMNATFQEKNTSEPVEVKLGDAGKSRLSMKNPVQLDTIRFVQEDSSTVLLPNHVEVHVKSVGINAKDVLVLGNKVDAKEGTCAMEFTGVITRVGSEVTDFAEGDRILVMAPNRFLTYECVPEWACCKLLSNEGFSTMSTIPIVYSTALYAIRDRAKLQHGETILIHSASGGLGIAAIQVAQMYGAEIFATVGTDAKKKYLTDTFGLKPDHIFHSRDSEFAPAIMTLTSGKGIDVVLNSLIGDLLHESWGICSEFGRFVEVGKRDIIEGGRLNMEMFEKNVTFTAFDLSSLFFTPVRAHNLTWKSLLHDSVQLFRSGKIKNVTPLKIFDVSELIQAYRYFSLSTRIGKVAISLEDPASSIKVVRRKHEYSFSPDKSYFLVGCLGGLGRSLSRWMMKRGARRFTFLGRSGLATKTAKDLVEELEKGGAVVQVIRGSVTKFSDVSGAISNISPPIGGIIHAAMGLDESLFDTMTHSSWHTSIDPKVHGTWNLHEALKGYDNQLDFFLLTSSISGSLGTATESNYCAANSFLDAFARHRRSLGLSALSIGLGMISEVGYLAEHPDIEALLLRKGLHPINEEELLQIVDLALCNDRDALQRKSPNDIGQKNDYFRDSHILTGLEVLGLKKQRNAGFEGQSHVLTDSRASLIAAALADDTSNQLPSDDVTHGNLPVSITKAIQSQDASLLSAAVQDVVVQKMSNLLLLPTDKLGADTKLADFGMDSMLAAEFRIFIFHVFEVDVPFLMLLGKTTSIGSLVQVLANGLLERGLDSDNV